MSEQEDRIDAMTDRVYQSMSRQLRCGNPIFNPVTYHLPRHELVDFTERDFVSVSVAVSSKLAADSHNVQVRYVPATRQPHEYMFVGTIHEKTGL